MLQTKTNKALKTIGETAAILKVAPHVIRFWESNFIKLKPIKYNGRRYYTNENIHMLEKIKILLHEKKFSIQETIIYINKPTNPLRKIKEKLIKNRNRLKMLIDNYRPTNFHT
jgi:DNA-binding transcriptional MerR regulator